MSHSIRRCAVQPLVLVLVTISAFGALSAQAARPLLTDDARVVDEGDCQLESWVMRERSTRQLWALPACSGGRGVEWALGGYTSKAESEDGAVDGGVVQYKRVLHPLSPGAIGVGVAVGAEFGRPRSGRYMYIPVSWMDRSERSVVHLNLGGSAMDSRSELHRNWGVGFERRVSESVWLVAERYSAQVRHWQSQAGVRWWVVTGRLQLDVTIGERHETAARARIGTIGLRWLIPAP